MDILKQSKNSLKKNSFSKIDKFIEKPNLEKAKTFIKDPHYVWNSGIFLFKASTILKELKKYAPEILELCDESLKKGLNDLDFLGLMKKFFKNVPMYPLISRLWKKQILDLFKHFRLVGTILEFEIYLENSKR